MIRKLFILSGIVIFIALFILILNINEKNKQQKQIKVYDNVEKILSHTLHSEKTSLLSLSIIFSRNRAIQDVVLENNTSAGYNILHTSTQMLKKHTDKQSAYIQIISNKLSLFARSWQKDISNIPFVTGRKNALKKLLHTYTPRTGLDLGLPLGIHASSVIQYKNRVLGILEAITPYDTIVSKMRSYQIEVIPLIYKSYVPIRYIDEQKLIEHNNYIVANKNLNMHLFKKFQQLNSHDLSTLIENDFLSKGSYLYLSYPIISVDNIKLGNFILLIKKENLNNFLESQKSIIQSIYTLDSSRDDIYLYSRQKEQSLFADIQKEYIATLRYSIDKKDIIEFEEIARKKLEKLKKDELIDLILYRYADKKLRGEIR